MKVSLVSIPMADWAMPPLGISSIKGFLLKNGIYDVKCYDLNIIFLYYCLTEERLEKSKQYILKVLEKSEDDRKQAFLYECLFNGEYLSDNIGEALEKLKNIETYNDIDIYKKYSSIVERTLKFFSSQYYPTTISSAAITFEKNGESVSTIEGYISDLTQNPLIEFYNTYLNTFIQADTQYVGISVNYSGQIIPALTLAKIIRKSYPEIKIIFGGSLFPAYSLRLKDLQIFAKYSDALIMYAGEYSWREILKNDCLKDIPGCMCSENGYFRLNSQSVPRFERCIPDFSDFKLNEYLVPQAILPYTMSIGCYWGKCMFCGYQSYKDPYTQRCASSKFAEDIFADLCYLNDKYDVKNFYFVDEAMPMRLGKKLAEKITESEKRFSWYSEFRFEKHLNWEYLSLLKNSGCDLIFFGLESGSDNVLHRMNKGSNTQIIEQVLKYCGKLGIKTMPMFFFGFPGETVEDAMKTIELLKRNSENIQHIAVGNFILLRNIPVYYHAEKFGISILKRTEELSLYDDYKIKEGITPKEAKKLVHRVYTDNTLKKYFNYNLLSRNHLIFLSEKKKKVENLKFDIEKKYVVNENCRIVRCFYDLKEQKKVLEKKYYMIDCENSSFYELPELVGDFFKSHNCIIPKEIIDNRVILAFLYYFFEEKVIIEGYD